MEAEQPKLANAACGDFYRRHIKYVYAVIDRANGSEPGKDGMVDMVTDTFLRVHEQASTYQPWGEWDHTLPFENHSNRFSPANVALLPENPGLHAMPGRLTVTSCKLPAG